MHRVIKAGDLKDDTHTGVNLRLSGNYRFFKQSKVVLLNDEPFMIFIFFCFKQKGVNQLSTTIELMRFAGDRRVIQRLGGTRTLELDKLFVKYGI